MGWRSPWVASIGIHASVAAVLTALYLIRIDPPKQIEFEVIEKPVMAPKALNVTPPKPEQQRPPPKTEQRKVFGVSRNALTDDAGETAVKLGNTLATEPDDKKLLPTDSDSLPIPTDEYLVTSMPTLLGEVRIPYPPDAKARAVEGPVVMELLIDKVGGVREVVLISGPDPALNDAAVKAARGLKFKPAMVENDTVAVKIRYTYRFVLER